MPGGWLSALTSGKTVERAIELAMILKQKFGDTVHLFCFQELYNEEATSKLRDIFVNAGFLPVNGPEKGFYKDNHYKYNSGQAIYVNTKTLDCSKLLQNNSCEDHRTANEADTRDTHIRENVKHAVEKKFDGEIMQVDTFAFPSVGIHGCNALESSVPKGVVRIRIQMKRDSPGGPLVFDVYNMHLQSCPLAWVYQFSPEKVRRKQLQALVKYINTQGNLTSSEDGNSNDVGNQSMLHEELKTNEKSIFIGDFNIAYNWDEFDAVKTLLNSESAIDKKFVTIGHVENTSHSSIIWKFGGLLYDHFEAQLDHCLITKDLKSELTKEATAKGGHLKFDTFPLVSEYSNLSLTDHEGIILEF